MKEQKDKENERERYLSEKEDLSLGFLSVIGA